MPRLIPLLTTLAVAGVILAFGAYFAATSSSGSGAEAANQAPVSPGGVNAGVGMPDLSVASITYGNGSGCDPVMPGVTVEIANIGLVDVDDSIIDLNGVQQSTGLIPASQSRSFFFIQQFFGPLTATSDFTNVVAESNEGNNALTVPPFPTPTPAPSGTCTPTVTPTMTPGGPATATPTDTPTPTPTATDTAIPTLPDLFVQSITNNQASGGCSTPAGVRIVVANGGSTASGPSSLFVDGFFGDEQTVAVPAIPGNGSVTVFSSVIFSPITATADSAFVITESNETNNSLTVNISVGTLPTCTWTSTPSPTHTFPPGGTFTPTFTPSPTHTLPPATATFTPTATPCGGPDGDGDGVPDCSDNCISVPNPGQENNDGNFIDNTPPTFQDDRTRVSSDPLGDACDLDDDNDGISDSDEGTGAFCYGLLVTDPLLSDTDGDRFLDGIECVLSTDPTNPASKPPLASCGSSTGDTDGDRISDRVEGCMYGTNPFDTDTDGDRNTNGATDGCEVASLNNDRVVNSGDQLLMVLEILRQPIPQLRIVSYDMNKDGAVNSGDQLFMALFVAPGSQCPSAQADLLIQSMSIELETGSSCAYTSTALGVRVVVRNNGGFQAPKFAVDTNGAQQSSITTLGPGAITSMWFAGYLFGNNSTLADAAFVVVESNEANNGLTQFLPIPTLPPTCTPTPPPTNTPTVTPTPTP